MTGYKRIHAKRDRAEKRKLRNKERQYVEQERAVKRKNKIKKRIQRFSVKGPNPAPRSENEAHDTSFSGK